MNTANSIQHYPFDLTVCRAIKCIKLTPVQHYTFGWSCIDSMSISVQSLLPIQGYGEPQYDDFNTPLKDYKGRIHNCKGNFLLTKIYKVQDTQVSIQ